MSSEIFKNLPLRDKKKLIKEEYEKIKKLKQEIRDEKLMLAYEKLQKQKEKLSQEKEKRKQKSKPKPKTKQKSKPKPKPKQKIKTFDEYFQECIKNKTIPKDTPPYLKKALERAMKEYDEGIKHEKSALSNFAEKYVIDGKPGLTPLQFFAEKVPQIKEFLRNHLNTKVRMILVCIMERITAPGGGRVAHEVFYFNTETFIILEKTEIKDILYHMINHIRKSISELTEQDSGWYFKEKVRLEIHTVDYKPMKGSSYIPLPEFIMAKKSNNQYGKRRQ